LRFNGDAGSLAREQSRGEQARGNFTGTQRYAYTGARDLASRRLQWSGAGAYFSHFTCWPRADSYAATNPILGDGMHARWVPIRIYNANSPPGVVRETLPRTLAGRAQPRSAA
jgi:hypothetical protein